MDQMYPFGFRIPTVMSPKGLKAASPLHAMMGGSKCHKVVERCAAAAIYNGRCERYSSRSKSYEGLRRIHRIGIYIGHAELTASSQRKTTATTNTIHPLDCLKKLVERVN